MPAETQTAFFSYCRDDSEFALKLAADLKKAGASVWIDQLDIEPGAEWDEAVEQALANSPRMVVILSPTSVDSKNVRDEVSFALSGGKRVIPILYRDCRVPFRLARIQHIDFRAEYGPGFSTLLKAMGIQLAAPAAGPGAPDHWQTEPESQPDKSELEEQERQRMFAAEETRRRKLEEESAAAEKARLETERRLAAENARRREEESAAASERARREQQERERIAAVERADQLKREEERKAADRAGRRQPETSGIEKRAASGMRVKAGLIAAAIAIAFGVWLLRSSSHQQPGRPDLTTQQGSGGGAANAAKPTTEEKHAGNLGDAASNTLRDITKPTSQAKPPSGESSGEFSTSNAGSRFVIGGPADAQTVLDTKSGLMWTRKDYWNVEGTYATRWKDAMDWAKKMNVADYAGYSDWRVPTIAQYRTINSSKADRDAYAQAFEKTNGEKFWSTNTPSQYVASYMSFSEGYAVSGDKEGKSSGDDPRFSVRLVRYK